MLGVGEEILLFVFTLLIIFLRCSIAVFLSFTALSFSALIGYLYWTKLFWKRHGIPGPDTNLFIGNMKQYHEGQHTMDEQWGDKYGDTYGSYVFNTPELTSSNIAILRKVLIKDFNCFTDRSMLLNYNPNDETDLIANSMLSMNGAHWASTRSQVAPAFSTNKIKHMTGIFSDCCHICMDILDDYAERRESVPIRNICVHLVLDMISKAAFGHDFAVQTDPENNEFIQMASKHIDIDYTSWKISALLLFPNVMAFIKKTTGWTPVDNEPNMYFVNMLMKLLDTRRKGEEILEHEDFFEILLKALKERQKAADVDKEIDFEQLRKSTKMPLTDHELVGQAFMFILAGYETVPLTLHLVIYLLAEYPEIQKKVHDEVVRVCGDKETITYDNTTRLPYLEQVIMETLRLYPPVLRTNRKCTKDIVLEGIPMKKGYIFSLPIRRIHHNPEIFPDPMKFDPDRMTPEARSSRDPMVFMPFGHGPRNCLGMRIGQAQMRMALAYLIRRYTFTLPDGAPTHPFRIDTTGGMKTVEPLFLNITVNQ